MFICAYRHFTVAKIKGDMYNIFFLGGGVLGRHMLT